jgi:uncharacterized protein (DUF58 family)
LTVPLPTWRLAIVAAVLAPILLALPGNGWSRLIVANVILVGVALIDAALAPKPSAITVERSIPGVLSLGVVGDVSWTIANPTRRSLTVAIADQLAPSLHAQTRRSRVRVPRRGEATVTTTIEPRRRGRFDIHDLTVRVEGPLGLAARQRARDMHSVLKVLPPFKSRDEAELRINRARILEVGLRSAQGRGAGTEFDQLREYAPDDEFRRIDWSATARTGKVIVRTYRAERNQTVLLLLDSGRVMAGRVEGVPRLEHAMDAVMMMTAVSTRLGDRTGMLAFGRTVRAVVPPSGGRAQLGRITDAMYDLDAQLAESDYRAAFTETMARFRRRALVVVLTELTEPVIAETLLPALPVMVRHHLVLVGGVRDPDVVRWARDLPDDASEAYRKAAAVGAIDDRRRAIARLRGMGATVIDATPGRLAPELADAYLKVKATGRL